MPRAKPPPSARPIPTPGGDPAPEGWPERPRPKACTERIILSRLFTGTSHHPGFARLYSLRLTRQLQAISWQVGCHFRTNRFIVGSPAPDYGQGLLEVRGRSPDRD